jgi:branched-chain amino acid transport system ATP-binding protein
VTTLLEVAGLTKRFGGLVAVNGVSFRLAAGEITGLLGPNGAGKTTVFNLLTGFLAPDAGDVRLAGASVRGLRPHAIVRRGMARTFQLARPFRFMSVLDNVAVACLAPHVRRTAPDVMARARRTLTQVGLEDKAPLPVEILPYGDLRRLEIARALATSPRVLLLDEPFAGLGAGEIQPLADLIRRLHAEGLGILLIEHKLREMMRLVGRVIALDFGEVIAEGRPEEIVRDPRVIEAYLGRDRDGDGAAGDR